MYVRTYALCPHANMYVGTLLVRMHVGMHAFYLHLSRPGNLVVWRLPVYPKLVGSTKRSCVQSKSRGSNFNRKVIGSIKRSWVQPKGRVFNRRVVASTKRSRVQNIPEPHGNTIE